MQPDIFAVFATAYLPQRRSGAPSAFYPTGGIQCAASPNVRYRPGADIGEAIHRSNMSDDAKLRMVQVVLRWAWDPIGLRGVIEAADEYDMYASAVLAMLKSSASDQLLADYLTNVVRDRMELAPNRETNRDIACMLRELYAITC